MRIVGDSASRAGVVQIAVTMAALSLVLGFAAPALAQSASGPGVTPSAASTSADKGTETVTAPSAGSAAAVSPAATSGASAGTAAPTTASEAASETWERVDAGSPTPEAAAPAPESGAGHDRGEKPAIGPYGTYRAQETQSMPSTTTEIPQAAPSWEPQKSGQSGSSEANGQIVNYEATQDPHLIEPQLHSLQEFIAEGENTSPLGLELREAQRSLKDGEKADGLLIVKVMRDSPAAKAGLRSYHKTAHDLLEGTAVAAALVFPPAVLAVPLIDGLSVGESYDMIIAVDGNRITNFLDFEDQMRDVRPGDVVYLSLVRDGARMQVPVSIPATASATSY